MRWSGQFTSMENAAQHRYYATMYTKIKRFNMKNKTKFLRNLVIIFGISLGVLILSEGILRIVFPDKVKNSNILDSIAYEFNEDFLISLRPNITKKYIRKEANGGYITRWKTNNNSFRGPSLRDDPTYRVIVYGDSNIQARFSGRTRTFPGQLARFLQESGIPDVEVINAGVIGFGPDQILIRFANEVDKYKPNLIIFHIFADNDFGDIIRNRLFSLDVNGNLTRTDYKTTTDAYLLVSERRKLKTFISQLLVLRALKKAASSLVKVKSSGELKGTNKQSRTPSKQSKENMVHELLEMVEAEYLVYKESQPRKFSHFTDHYDIDIALYPNQESSKMKTRLMEEVLKEASKLASAKGISLLVLIQPSIKDTTKDNALLTYEYLQQYPNYKKTNLTDAVEKICVSHNIHSINLFNVFMENGPEDLFFRAENDHWTDRGQQLAAKETARYINDNSMLKNK